MIRDSSAWYALSNVEEVTSPALLIYPDRVEENIRRMIAVAGGVRQLRPHVKTHKLPEVIRMQMAHGILRFKTATIAEAEVAAACGAPDILIAYQPVGPNVPRVLELTRRFPSTRFSTIVDDADVLHALSDGFRDAGRPLNVFLDIDCGMHRTGVSPNDEAVELYRLLGQLPGVRPAGLHAYDGHIHDLDPNTRAQRCNDAFEPVFKLRSRLVDAGQEVPAIVAGGTPTFPVHAARLDVECSPGTCLLWDSGYSAKLPDMDFLPAALLLTRVVSKPGGDRLCLDLGHKAVASENPPPRVQFLGLPSYEHVGHSEEHLVIETPHASEFRAGDCLYGIPWHICPTVALHSEAVVVRDQRAGERWTIAARQRRLTI